MGAEDRVRAAPKGEIVPMYGASRHGIHRFDK